MESAKREKKYIAWHVIFLFPPETCIIYPSHEKALWRCIPSSNTCLRMNVCCTNKTRMKKTWSGSIINHIVLHHCVFWIYACIVIKYKREKERNYSELWKMSYEVLCWHLIQRNLLKAIFPLSLGATNWNFSFEQESSIWKKFISMRWEGSYTW